jgi:hypothetical protein
MAFLSALAALKGLALLVRGQLGFAAELDATRLGAGASFAGARADQCRLSDARLTIGLFVGPCPIVLKNSSVE